MVRPSSEAVHRYSPALAAVEMLPSSFLVAARGNPEKRWPSCPIRTHRRNACLSRGPAPGERFEPALLAGGAIGRGWLGAGPPSAEGVVAPMRGCAERVCAAGWLPFSPSSSLPIWSSFKDGAMWCLHNAAAMLSDRSRQDW